MAELKDILSKLKKQGLSVVVSNEKETIIERIPSGSIGLDRILGGGYPRGRITEIYGEPSSGKSIMAYLAISEVQKRGGVAALVDVENSYTRDWGIHLGIDPDKLIVVGATDDEGLPAPKSGETFLENIVKLIETDVDLIVLDSISTLTPQVQIEKGLDEGSAIADQARMLSSGLRKINNVLSAHNQTALIVLNQVRSNPGVMFGNPNKSTGGKALEFYDSVKLSVFRRSGAEYTYYKDEKNKDEGIVGQRLKVTTEKNKLYRPKMSCEFDVFFDIGPKNLSIGVDTTGELLTECLKAGIVTRPSSAMYDYNGKSYRGQLAIMQAIKDSEDLQKELKAKLEELNVSN